MSTSWSSSNIDRTCSYCGAVAEASDAVAGAWTFAVDNGRVTWLCVDCARLNIRNIEAKLPEDYWR
jgi:hypothetical protein